MPQKASSRPRSQERVVPVIAERLSVQKRRVETGRVRIAKRVRHHRVIIDPSLRRDEAVVERVKIGEFVDTVPAPRWDGDTLIIPILEEVPVVTRRLRVIEELRIRRRTSMTRRPQVVDLRREEAVVERMPAPEASWRGRRVGQRRSP